MNTVASPQLIPEWRGGEKGHRVEKEKERECKISAMCGVVGGAVKRVV
jgi:hypothetical protein